MTPTDHEEKTQDRTLPEVESGVCDWLRASSAVRDPWADRLGPKDRHSAMRDLADRLGPRYAFATLQGYEIYHERQRKVVEQLRCFAEHMPERMSESGGLMLFGDAGTGKDHLIAALLKIAIAKHNLRVLWYDAGDLFDEFYFAIKADNEEVLRDLIRKLRRPHILAISDPQPPQGSLSDSQLRRLRDLIDKRYRFGLSTWITTNIDNRQLAEDLLTAPVVQRLKEGSGIFLCDWQSYRERKKGWQ